jgi:lipoyl(octanoyl) transferase
VSACRPGARRITRSARLLELGTVEYREALELQHSVAAAVADGSTPDTVLLLEHPPTITLGRRTEEGEVHVPPDARVEIVEVDRGGKSTYHGPGQLVCYPIFDLTRHGQDVKRYCRDLEEALARTLSAFGLEGTRIEGLTGVWLQRPPRKIASIGIHLTKWISTHGYALNVDLDPAPFTEWITACGLDGYAFTSMARELGRPVTVDDVRPAAAQALADVFDLAFTDIDHTCAA